MGEAKPGSETSAWNSSQCDFLRDLVFAIREEDFAEVKDRIDALRKRGVTDFQRYFIEHPKILQELVAGIGISAANAAAIEMYGAADAAAFLSNFAELRQTPGHLALYRAAISAFAAGATRFRQEQAIAGWRAAPVTVDAAAHIRAGETSWSRVFWVEYDISEYKRLEAELRMTEARLDAVVTHAPVAIALQDIDGHVLLANPHAGQLHGVSPEKMLGKSPGEFLPKERACVLSALDREVVESRSPVETETRLENGSKTRQVVLLKFPVLGQGGEAVAVGTFAVDVTEQRKAEAEAKQLADELAYAERRAVVGQMSAALSHELNQPVTAMLNYARGGIRRLRSGKSRPEELLELLQKIAGQAERAGDIIHQLKHFIRNGSGEVGKTNVNGCVSNVLKLANATIKYHGITVIVRLCEDLPKVMVDRIAVEQAILNLITNAVEAMAEPASGEREITVWTALADGSDIEIGVSDTGPGIPAPYRDRIFEPFFTTKEKGTGLGLWITQNLVERFGGSIRASPNPHGGETFRITLPAVGRVGRG